MAAAPLDLDDLTLLGAFADALTLSVATVLPTLDARRQVLEIEEERSDVANAIGEGPLPALVAALYVCESSESDSPATEHVRSALDELRRVEKALVARSLAGDLAVSLRAAVAASRRTGGEVRLDLPSRLLPCSPVEAVTAYHVVLAALAGVRTQARVTVDVSERPADRHGHRGARPARHRHARPLGAPGCRTRRSPRPPSGWSHVGAALEPVGTSGAALRQSGGPVTTVLICDDLRPVREGLRRNVAAVPGVDRVETVDNAEELLSRYPLERPDLVLMSLHLSGTGASEATRRLVREHPEANVVVMAQGDDRDSVVQAIAGGARGFLQRDVSREELCAAVAHALAGADLFSAGIPAPRTVRELAPEGAPDLTERELQVLRGMSEGKSNGEIGRELYLSEDTVKTHARRLFRKLGVNDRAQAVALGFRRGLVH